MIDQIKAAVDCIENAFLNIIDGVLDGKYSGMLPHLKNTITNIKSDYKMNDLEVEYIVLVRKKSSLSKGVSGTFQSAREFHLNKIKEIDQRELEYEQVLSKNILLDPDDCFDVRLTEVFSEDLDNSVGRDKIHELGEMEILTCWFPTAERFKEYMEGWWIQQGK